MRAEWRDVLEQFYEKKNRAWLSGDSSEMVEHGSRPDVVQSCIEEIQALQRSAKDRGIHYLKSRTNIKWTEASLTARGKARIDLLEQVTWIYQDGDELKHQARMQPVRMMLEPSEGRWTIGKVDRLGEKDERNVIKAALDFRVFDSNATVRRYPYDRRKAQRYAELWWNGFNPQYKKFDVDCTNFVSQCLSAGGMPMDFAPRKDRGWWYRFQGPSWSYSWAVAHALRWYLENSGRAKSVANPQELMIGDVICYDWDGNGRWEHNTIVVDFDRNGMPLVNAHTVASHRRYWDYKDSYAWTENTNYRFFHILDSY